jgi:hypothetical protein
MGIGFSGYYGALGFYMAIYPFHFVSSELKEAMGRRSRRRPALASLATGAFSANQRTP